VVGAADASGLIKTFVFVIPRDEATDPEGLAAELRQLAESSLPAHERPREIRVVRELPRTDTGKLKRFLLKEEVEGRR
jgi:acyl-coenzyme A synthetase/AMP-(fatty) acid ligase